MGEIFQAIKHKELTKPTFIFFDLDDTLLDHKKSERSALLETREHFPELMDVDPQILTDTYHRINKELWNQYNHGKINKEELQQRRFADTLAELNVSVDDSKKVGDCYINAYQKYWDWISGAEKVYSDIQNHYDVGILTNGFSETQWKKIKEFGFDKSAQFNVISEEVGHLKPHPKIFEHATKLTGKTPEEILYVGDSFNSDIEGASAFGWKTAWFTQSTNGNGHPADFVFSDFNQLKEKLLSKNGSE